MEIRKLGGGDDLFAVSRVYEESWHAAYHGLLPQDYLDGIPAGNWVPFLKQAGRESLIMLDGGRIVGAAGCRAGRLPELPGWGEIISIYLLPEYWGKGWGKRLFSAAVEQLEAMGCRGCFLWVLKGNQRARAFYARMGFWPNGTCADDEIGGVPVQEILYCGSTSGGKRTGCVLRPWRQEDAGDLAALLSDKGILDNLRDGLPYPYTEADAAQFIAAMRAADPGSTYAFAITAGGRAVGCISAQRRENIHSRTAEVGYYIARPLWGRGLATCALRQLCDLLFEATDLLRLFAEPFAENAASCRALEKAGFQLEGVLRSNAVKNGAVRDTKLYAWIREQGVRG